MIVKVLTASRVLSEVSKNLFFFQNQSRGEDEPSVKRRKKYLGDEKITYKSFKTAEKQQLIDEALNERISVSQALKKTTIFSFLTQLCLPLPGGFRRKDKLIRKQLERKVKKSTDLIF